MFVVTVDKDKCDGKGECVDTCPVNVLAALPCTLIAVSKRSW